MSSSDSSLSISDDELVLGILCHLPRPRLFRDRSNPLEEFDEQNRKRRRKIKYRLVDYKFTICRI